MDNKTNVIRLLDNKKIKYRIFDYSNSGAVNGMMVASILNQNPHQVFKTLVTVGKSKTNYVFMISVSDELDLKKAAKIVNEKSIEMIKEKDLYLLTGYVHGGCSPIGMKKNFKTIIDIKVLDFDTILFSGGRIGLQIETSLIELKKVINLSIENIKIEE